MTLRHHYSQPADPLPSGDTTLLDRVRLEDEQEGWQMIAALGEAAISRVVLEDAPADLDLVGLRRWYLVEDEETPGTPGQVVWYGYVARQRISRWMPPGGQPVAVGSNLRRWDVELVELNAILSLRIITGSDGNRPAETAAARLTWLLASDYRVTVRDNGMVVYSSRAMDAVDYRGQTAADVLRDIALTTGYNFFVYYDETRPSPERVALWFDNPNTSTTYSSSIKISNFLPDVDNVTVLAPSIDAVLERDPERVAAGIYLPYDGGWVYDYNPDTVYEFGFRDRAAPSANVKTAAKAQAIVDRLLVQHSVQEETIRVSVQLTPDNLNDIKAGQRLQVKFSHLPGFQDYRWCRVVSKRFGRFGNLAEHVWDVELELSPQSTAAVGASCTAVCSDPVALVQSASAAWSLNHPAVNQTGATVTLASPPVPGNTIFVFVAVRDEATVPTFPAGYTVLGSWHNGDWTHGWLHAARKCATSVADQNVTVYIPNGTVESCHIVAEFSGTGQVTTDSSAAFHDESTGTIEWPSPTGMSSGIQAVLFNLVHTDSAAFAEDEVPGSPVTLIDSQTYPNGALAVGFRHVASSAPPYTYSEGGPNSGFMDGVHLATQRNCV